MMVRLLLTTCFLVSWTSSSVHAHGERPRALHIEFSSTSPDTIWVLSHTQGIFANLKTGFSWVCEDSVYAGAPTVGVAVSGERGERWVIATGAGLFVSTDRACNFARSEGVVGAHELTGLWFHTDATEYLVASRTPMARNDVFISRDQGETWSPLGLDIAGAIKAVHWAESNPEQLYVHHRYGVHRSEDLGRSLIPVDLSVDGLGIPPELVRMLSVSPIDADKVLAIIDVGERSRILSTSDGGRTWSDAALIDSRELSAVMHPDGQNILLVNPFGDAWRSKDGGATWEVGETVPISLGCFRIKPGTHILYACSDPDVDGPWVAGRSEDFGQTWHPVFADFETASHRDDCGGQSKSTICCRGLCPGDQTAEMCGQPDVGALPELCQPRAAAVLPLLDGGVEQEGATLDTGSAPSDGTGGDTSPSSQKNEMGTVADSGHLAAIDGSDGRNRIRNEGCDVSGSSGSLNWIYYVFGLGLVRRRIGWAGDLGDE